MYIFNGKGNNYKFYFCKILWSDMLYFLREFFFVFIDFFDCYWVENGMKVVF